MTSIEPYRDALDSYLHAGWRGVLPIVAKAGNLPVGCTGREGVDPDPKTLDEWRDKRGVDNIALRMPANVLGIDVDAHGVKQGHTTLGKAVAVWGPLPPTWRSTARGESDGLSGIYFFRVDPDVEFLDRIELDGTSSIELIRHVHRYAVVAPSIHPDTGTVYQWFGPDGLPVDCPPSPDDFPRLPEAWAAGLKSDRVVLESHDPVDVEPCRAPRDMWASDVMEAFSLVQSAALGEKGSRHDTARDAIAVLARAERRGHAGATSALEDCVSLWVELMGDERGSGNADREVREMVEGGRALVASTPTTAVEAQDLAWAASLPHASSTPPSAPPVELPPLTVSLRGELLSVDAVSALPPPVPLLDGWLFRHSAAALSAPPKSGKTFVALDMALSLASGCAWVGGRVPHRGRVLYMIGEGVSGVGQRVAAWKLAHPDARPEGHVDFIPRAVPFRDPTAALELIQLAEEEKYDLIVVDTLARAAVGMEENSAKEMGMVVAILDRLKVVSDACVLVVHHTGKDASRGLRGSSAVAGALDTSIVCEGDVRNLWVKTDFQKDSEGDRQIQLTFRAVGSSIVPELAGEGFERNDGEDHALEVLRWGGVPITRSEWREQLISRGMDRNVAYNTIGALIDRGAVVSPDEDESRNGRWKVVG